MPTTRVDDIELFYDTAGSGDPVFMVAGMGADHRAWGFFFRAVSRRYMAVRYDHRGIGKSTRGTKPMTSETLAEDLLGLMDGLEVKRAHIIGASMGGPVAVIAATRSPQRAGSLTLAITTPKVDEAHKALFGELRDMLAAEGMEAYARRLVPLCFSEQFRRSEPESIERIVRGLIEREPETQALLEQIDGCIPADVVDLLPRVTCPTLVLDAGRDELIQPSAGLLVSRIPDARALTFAGSGHDIFVERPDRTSREILAFLSNF